MEPEFFQGLGIEREEAKRYGRFKALDKEDSEELARDYNAKNVAINIRKEIDQAIEHQLVEKGHISAEEEISLEKFQETHDRLQNIDKEWKAAFKQKDYSEVDVSDLKTLESLVSDFFEALKYEIKVTEYIERFNSQLSNLEVDESAVKVFLGIEDNEGGSEVGKHLEKLNKEQRYDLEDLSEEVQERLESNREDFEAQIKSFGGQIEMYREHLDILEAVQKEVEEIKEETEDEEVEERADEIIEMLDDGMNLTLDLIKRKSEVLENHTKAKNLKKNVNKLFLNGTF